MSPQTLFLLMAMMLVAIAWYANTSKRDKIYCSFTRRNRTSIHKFVKMQSQFVVFDGARYRVVPSCIVFDWWTQGLVHMLFPQWVATLDFTFASEFPKDPKTNQPVVLSPEVRKLMDKEELWREYNKTMIPNAPKKGGIFQQYLPMISLLLVGLLGVYVVMNFKAFNEHLTFLDNMIRSAVK